MVSSVQTKCIRPCTDEKDSVEHYSNYECNWSKKNIEYVDWDCNPASYSEVRFRGRDIGVMGF